MLSFHRCIICFTILFTILVVLIFSACEKETKTHSDIAIKDGLIFKQGELKPYTGIVKDTIEEKIIEYGVVDGKKTGEFKTYFKNGTIEMIGNLKDNLNQGKWTYYYQTGQVESEGTFKDDLPDGRWKWFYENGNLKEEGVYISGNREGLWILYDEGGKVKEKRMLERNKIIQRK